MVLLANDIQAVFWIAVIPAFISVAILILAVKEPQTTRHPGDSKGETKGEARSPIQFQDLRQVGAPYWWLVIVGAVLALARFSEAFLVLRAENVGILIALVPLVFVVMNAVYAASAYPAGTLSDRMDRRYILAIGFVVLIVADVVLALATGIGMVIAGVVLWGLHMGLPKACWPPWWPIRRQRKSVAPPSVYSTWRRDWRCWAATWPPDGSGIPLGRPAPSLWARASRRFPWPVWSLCGAAAVLFATRMRDEAETRNRLILGCYGMAPGFDVRLRV